MAQSGRSNPDELEWIDFADFRSGVMFDRTTGSQKLPVGAARHGPTHTAPETYGCVADHLSGWLMPLPAVASSKTLAAAMPRDLSGVGNVTTHYPANNYGSYCLDARVIAPVHPTAQIDTFVSGRAEYVAGLFAFFYADAGGGAGNYRSYVLGRMWDGTTVTPWSGSKDFHFQKSTAAIASTPHPFPIGSLIVGRSVQRSDAQPFNISMFRPALGFSSLFPRLDAQAVTTAMTATDQTLTTYDNDTGSATYQSGPTVADQVSCHGVWPNLTTAADDVTNLERLSQWSQMLVAHQGRIVAASSGPWAAFQGSNSLPLDYIGYNPVPGQWDAAAAVTSYNFLSAVDENPSGFGAAGSLSANTFFAVKHAGGGYVVQGDLDNPDIIRLPFVHSTGGIMSHGALTPLGFVYLGRDGAYVFKGGDSTQLLSVQLGVIDSATNRQWWDYRIANPVTEELFPGAVGRIAWWDPFIVFPNEWLFDTRSSSWWRMESNGTSKPAMSCFDVSASTGDLFGFPYKIWQLGTDFAAFRIYAKNSLRSSYQWASHVVPNTSNRMVQVREIDLFLEVPEAAATAGTGTVTFTIYYVGSGGGVTSATKVVTYDRSLKSQTIRVTSLSGGGSGPIIGTNLRFTVAVDSTNTAVQAPRVAFRVGVREDRQIRATV